MVIPIPGLYTVEKRQLFCHQSKSRIPITMSFQLIDLYRPILYKTDLIQCRFTNTKFYQNPRSSVKSESWTAQREYGLSITVFSLCTLYRPLLSHFVYSLHIVTMSLSIFSACHYYVILCSLCVPLLCSLCAFCPYYKCVHYVHSVCTITCSSVHSVHSSTIFILGILSISMSGTLLYPIYLQFPFWEPMPLFHK